jgi:hypothetical protein
MKTFKLNLSDVYKKTVKHRSDKYCKLELFKNISKDLKRFY